jgi:hypothetical protein
MRRLAILIALTFLTAACGDDDAATRPTSTPTDTATVAPPPTSTAPPVPPTPTITASPLPPPPTTAAPTATATPVPPSPTSTPSATPEATDFDVVASAPRFVIPGDTLPAQFQTFSSNNNVDILFYAGRLYLAWRAAPNHFAGPDTHLYIMSSGDGGQTWDFEHDVFLATDMREPRLLGYAGYLQLLFFEAGSDSGQFTPRRLWRMRRLGPAQWSPLELLTDAGEVPWDLKIHDGIAYRTSYLGEHYGSGETSEVAVFFRQSSDGTTWTDVGGRENVYFGGVSEVAFDFDRDGRLWAVTRNEDGDASGFGSHLCTAPPDDLAAWDCPSVTDPERYDSPEMFRHGDDLYLLARRDVGGPYDAGDDQLSLAERRGRYLIAYSLRPKRFALYKIDRTARRVVHVMDLPGVGDTAFPSVQQTGPHTFLVANYTSPLDDPDITWLRGQTSPRGTQIYLLELTFVPYSGGPRSPTPTWTATPSPTPPVLEQGARVVASPAFAAPGTALAITWPEGTDLGQLNLGDGAIVDASTTSHAYAPGPDTVFPVSGFVEIDGVTTQFAGAVARTATRATTPLNGFTLTEPLEPVVQQIIRGVMPAFYYALDADTLAVATDATGMGDFNFDGVVTSALVRNLDGTFASAAADYTLELSGVGGTHTGLIVHLVNTSLSGALSGTVFVGPAHLAGEINVLDVADAAAVLAGLDRPAAIAFVAGLFGFDPNDPPETVPFQAELGVD